MIDNTNSITTKYSYDAYNNQSKVEITNNNQSIITETIYKNSGSQLDKVINEEGKTTSYAYNDKGLIQTITDPNGTKLNYEYENGKGLYYAVIKEFGMTTGKQVYRAIKDLGVEEANGRN